uniref:Uncharacterized protein n=1 Tax=Lutzomyia longipalpis TaxID=7200 RepID=A0A1B0CB56_LUTLO
MICWNGVAEIVSNASVEHPGGQLSRNSNLPAVAVQRDIPHKEEIISPDYGIPCKHLINNLLPDHRNGWVEISLAAIQVILEKHKGISSIQGGQIEDGITIEMINFQVTPISIQQFPIDRDASYMEVQRGQVDDSEVNLRPILCFSHKKGPILR